MRKKALAMACAILLILALCTGCAENDTVTGGKTVVHFLNWGDYIDPETIPLFEEEHPDITVKMTTVPSNEEMYVIATTEGTQIDVIVPSEYMIQRLMAEDQLAQIDTSSMENFGYVEEFAATTDYDPQAKYSIPYTWGTFGIMYNETMVDEEVDSWDILFDEKYAGQIMMYDSIRDSVGVALLKLGYDLNSQDADEIDAAADLLVAQKPLVLAYGTDDLRMSMVNGSAALSVIYSGDAAYSMVENEDLRYAIPDGGANIFVDAFCILKGTDAYDASLAFIDFLCRPDIAALNANYTGYSTPIDAAKPMIDEELMENEAFNPPIENLENCVYYKHIEKAVLRLYEDAWMKVKIA
ncbi:MAG: ABC transporter substrate-binding protein [Christensenellaceae bacterium]|jgi:spermidine/putrescine transport system substrate-binding protein